MSDWSQSELEALERGAPMSVMGQIRARREVRAAAGKVDPADVNFGMALGLERCGICKFYEPSGNPMTGGCSVVDKYRVERNNWCEMFEIADPSTSGSPGGAVARAAAEFYNLVVGPGRALENLLDEFAQAERRQRRVSDALASRRAAGRAAYEAAWDRRQFREDARGRVLNSVLPWMCSDGR